MTYTILENTSASGYFTSKVYKGSRVYHVNGAAFAIALNEGLGTGTANLYQTAYYCLKGVWVEDEVTTHVTAEKLTEMIAEYAAN